MSEAPRIGYREVRRLIEEGAQVFDALPSEDYVKEHIVGAINIPLGHFSTELLRGLDATRPTVTYCADNECDLSARLAARLVAEKFAQVYEYAASLADWKAYSLPIEGEEAGIARAGGLARRDFPACRPDERLGDIAGRLGEHSLCAVVDDAGVLLGRLRRKDIERKPDSPAWDVMHPGPSTFRPDVCASRMTEWFEKRKADAFIITTPDGRPFGILYRVDVERELATVGNR
jgi:rhodanese-related sulfurtransferase